MCVEETRKAKDLYSELCNRGLMSPAFEGLMGDAVWISSGDRAYRLSDLSDGHLHNIAEKYRKKEELVPDCIALELFIRREPASTQ